MDLFTFDDDISPMRQPHFSPTGMFYFRLTMLVMASFSALMHTVFIKGIWRLCGFGARSAYLVLGCTAFFGLSVSITSFISCFLSVIGMKWNDCVIMWRVSGGVFVATELVMTVMNLYLFLQRIACIFYPLKVKTILCWPVILICFFLAFVFYALVIAICLSPYAGAAYIPEHNTYKTLSKLPFSSVLSSSNDVTNYCVALTSLIAYPPLLLVLKFKLKFRNLNDEIRLTSQVALSVGVEVIFFMLWEFHSAEGVLLIFIINISGVLYYNAVTLPYFIMNKLITQPIQARHFSLDQNNATFFPF